ncbi:MAG TPA: NAD-dependent epimerase/dehydratase family protein, partial [Chloroflexia bacterium]|nr:NAD-dependent epimerase/dehydratase family protein [Chloroflexia bacterium]
VRMVNRSGWATVPAGVEIAQADVTSHEDARRACAGASVVYNCTNAPYTQWPQTFPLLMAGVIEGAASVGAKLVVGDNLYMYGPVRGPMTEDLPYAATGRKGLTRARIAQVALDAHNAGRVRVAIGRASDFYGPGVLDSAMGQRVCENVLRGKPADLLGDIDAPHSYTYIEDFAGGLATLGERDEALGHVWHLPIAQTLTTRQFVQMVFQEAGLPIKLRVAPRPLITIMALFNPIIREIKEMLYEFEEPFVLDHSKFEHTFGSNPTPHEEAIRQTLDWYRQRLAEQDVARQPLPANALK